MSLNKAKLYFETNAKQFENAIPIIDSALKSDYDPDSISALSVCI